MLRPRDGGASGRFVGWLEDATGAKRIHFTFPSSGESTIQVGVFEANVAAGGSGKESATVPLPPVSARGESFSGPLVGSTRYTLGQPVAIGMAKLRAEHPPQRS